MKLTSLAVLKMVERPVPAAGLRPRVKVEFKSAARVGTNGLDLVDRCRRSQPANRSLEVILRKGDWSLDLSNEAYIEQSSLRGVGDVRGQRGDRQPRTIMSHFLSRSEYERE